MFRRYETDTREAPGIRYIYWGLTGARVGPSTKPGSRQPPPLRQPPQPFGGAAPDETIARLTAERDAARSERELETDYREALLRDIEMLRAQLAEAQHRIREFETASSGKTERERDLERELAEAHRRIRELQPSKHPDAAPPPGDEMLDVFLQFVDTQERRPDVNA